jgi:transposase
MHYVGVDLHKEQSWFCILDEQGTKIFSKSITNSEPSLKAVFEFIPKPFKLAVESTFNWYFFVDMAELYAEEVMLANSYELKAFAKRNKKTDKIDARLIADVLRKGYLPSVRIAPKKIREIREMLRYRVNLTRERTSNINKLKNLLAKLGKESNGDFTTHKRLAAINIEEVEEIYREVITGYIATINHLTTRIAEMRRYVEDKASEDDDVNNLITIPGIGYFSAALIKSEIIDVKDFASFSRLCAYAGLAPRVNQSGNKDIHGPLGKNRRKMLQWILIEIVIHYLKAVPASRIKYDEMAKRKGHNTAKIAIARDILKVVYSVLKEKREYYV